MKKYFKNFILILLAVVFLFLFSAQTSVVTYGLEVPEGNHIVSTKKTNIVPGVVENEIIYNKPDGKSPVLGFFVDINLGSSVNIMAASKNYNEPGTQIVREMAAAAENKTGRNVVAAINADLNWRGTGYSTGPMIIDGEVITDIPALFFGIKKNGEAIIGDAAKFSEVKDDLEQAVRGMSRLVEDGVVIATSTSLAPRTAVGIKEDGSVVFVVIDGRGYPRSVGIGLKDLAELMLSYGCVWAVNLDGGGSSTYLSKPEGETELILRNMPSDGVERQSISSLLVYADTGDGTFHHAAIQTKGDIYTPGSEVEFTAQGVDSSGGGAELPESLIWKLEDEAFGTINQDGIFLSSGLEGEVVVYLEDAQEKKVGSLTIEIRTPDEILFASSEYSLGFNDVTSFGLRLLYEQREVIFKDGDVIWEYDEDLGIFSDNIFTSDSDNMGSTTVKGTINNTEIYAELELVVGKLPIVLFDFEEVEFHDLWAPDGVNGGEADLAIIHRDSGEPVRYGDYSLRVDFDFATNFQKFNAGAYAGFKGQDGLPQLENTFYLPGTPQTIGMWVYATEEAQGIWLRVGLLTATDASWAALDLTSANPGINWTGWKYVEANLAGVHPYRIIPNQLIRLMIITTSFGGNHDHKPIGSIYVDDIVVTYGTNPEDLNAPEIDYVLINDELIETEEVITIDTNNITVETLFADFEDEYATGIDFERVGIYVDGVNYMNDFGALNITDGLAYLQNVYLTDGVHEIKVVVFDNAGNEAVETRYINVDTNTNNKLYFIEDEAVVLGKTYAMTLKADEIDNIDEVEMVFRVSDNLSDVTVVPSSAFEVEYEYLHNIRLLNVSAKRINDDEVAEILTLNFEISKELSSTAYVTYRILKGEFKYSDDLAAERFLKNFTIEPGHERVVAPYKVDSNMVLVNHDVIFSVTDYLDDSQEGVEIILIDSEGDVSLGFTNELGQLVIENFLDEAIKFRVFAKLGEDVSFEYENQALDSYGELDGTPYNVKSNGVKESSTSKNISWFSNIFASEQEAFAEYALLNDYQELGEDAFIRVDGLVTPLALQGSSRIDNNKAVNINNVVVEGLESGKQYAYRVGNGQAWSDIRTFKTPNFYADMNILVLGDIQTDNFEEFTSNLEVVANDGIDYDFVIQTGDMVDQGDRFDFWNETLNPISESFLADLDMVHVLGNHEYYGDEDGDISKLIYNFPDNNDVYYSVEYGNVYVAVLGYNFDQASIAEAMDWLIEDAGNSNARWKILTSHQPAYTARGGESSFYEQIPPAAEAAGIDIMISGHDHSYARTTPLLNHEPDEAGITYVIAGAFGEKGYATVDNPDYHFVVLEDSYTYIYLSIEITEFEMTINVHDVSTNSVVDEFTITKDFGDHEHNYYLVDDRMVCYDCYYSREIGNHTGFLRTLDDKIRYYINGQYVVGLYQMGDNMYYFDEEGYAYQGTVEIYGLETTFDENGIYIEGGIGFTLDGTNTVYYDKLVMLMGWQEINDKIYYFSQANGRMATGKATIRGRQYNFGSDGALLYGVWERNEQGMTYYYGFNKVYNGWLEIDGYWYYFSFSNGVMRSNIVTNIWKHLGKYEFNEYGQLIAGAFVEDELGIRYYFGPQEEDSYEIGFQLIKDDIYYFDENGYLQIGEFTVNGVLFKTNSDGVIVFE